MRNFASAVLPQAILLPPLLPQNGGFPAKTIDNNRLRKCDSVLKTHALVAQLDRASVCETLAVRFAHAGGKQTGTCLSVPRPASSSDCFKSLRLNV